MVFNNYYLWFLLDFCYFKIEDIAEIYTFEKNRVFNYFTEDFMRKRIESEDPALNLFYKICLKGSYGYDIMNEENFTKFGIKNEKQTFLCNMTPNFVSSKKLRDGENPLYQVQMIPKSY
jgi:hypothetical protein